MSKHNEHSIKEAIELLLKAYKLDDRACIETKHGFGG